MTHPHPANRLIHQTSPYLLQHAHNPVDWYPWSEEAFAAAREQNRPVFLSVGYSACHWCHVMERESFENPQIAELMNRWFINIKVDREERPDVDQIYMSAVQLMTGRGGWPMSVFMTPAGEPFFGGTYWPPVSRQGRLGFAEILTRIHQYWDEHHEECFAKGQELVAAMNDLQHHQQTPTPLNEELLQHAQHRLLQAADRSEGGFGGAPKFPHPVDVRVLLRCSQRFGSADALAVATLTLDKMAAGGIYDHLGGGFARYSTDRFWLVPHFEKMLYDNSQLVSLYLEGYQATGNPEYLRVIFETLNYVMTEMTSPEGAFYATEDADSEGVEGKFYVWSAAEIEQLLDERTARIFSHCYQVSPGGNWEGHNILHRQQTDADDAHALGITVEELHDVLGIAKARLFAVRGQRVRPGRDEKIIVCWNGLMISALARADLMLPDRGYRQAAAAAADLILDQMRRPDGTLWHCRKDGQNQINGFLDDYAAFIESLCDLYQAGAGSRYYQKALQLTEVLLAQFYDPAEQAFHYTPADHENLVIRLRDRHDSAIPSGSNLAITALVRIGNLAGREDWLDIARRCLITVSGTIRQQPSAMGQALLALDWLLGPTDEAVLCCGSNHADNRLAQQKLTRPFSPRRLILVSSSENPASESDSPLLQGKTAIHSEVTLYLCQQGACDAPLIGRAAIETTDE